jgi:hypothetical protein
MTNANGLLRLVFKHSRVVVYAGDTLTDNDGKKYRLNAWERGKVYVIPEGGKFSVALHPSTFGLEVVDHRRTA